MEELHHEEITASKASKKSKPVKSDLYLFFNRLKLAAQSDVFIMPLRRTYNKTSVRHAMHTRRVCARRVC